MRKIQQVVVKLESEQSCAVCLAKNESKSNTYLLHFNFLQSSTTQSKKPHTSSSLDACNLSFCQTDNYKNPQTLIKVNSERKTALLTFYIVQ